MIGRVQRHGWRGRGRMGGHVARYMLVLLAGMMVAAQLAAPSAAALSVVVTIKPLHALVARVMGDTGSPQLLVQGSLSAHTYALKPSDAAKLHAADVFF